MSQILFRDRDEWRKWLDTHHATKSEVWLIYYKKRSGKESIQYEEAVEEALCYGWIDSKVMRLDDERYKQKYTPRKTASNWSKSNKERAKRLIRGKRMTPAGFAAIEQAKRNGSWDRLDDIEVSHQVVPKDLAKAFAQNATAKRKFERIAASYRKQYLWWLKSAKKPETRRKRLATIVDRCAQGLKPGIGP